MEKLLRKFIYHASALVFAAVVVIAFIQVICRYVFNNSLTWSEELMRYMFIWMFFVAMAESTRTGAHLGLDIVPDICKKNPTANLILQTVIDVLCISFLVFLVYFGFEISGVNMGQKSAALLIPLGYIYAALPVGAILMIFYQVRNIIIRFRDYAKLKKGGASES
ncbi:MAG: TRAP transporter small permease [Eubacteriales bacterium]|jgi:TRAP-type C4-dicarboxylate transport system permease small subunit